MVLARVFCLVALCGLIPTLFSSPASAQEDDELRVILKLLEKRLAQGEAPAAARATERVTEIGSSRRPVVVEEEEKEVVRIYDLSDLFTIAPPYAARRSSDLQVPTASLLTGNAAANMAMFPTPGGGQYSSGGGLGGGLSGIGGGVFNVPEGSLPQVGGFGLSHGPDAEGNFGGSRISFDNLIDAITNTIEPTEWEDVGGPGTIQPLGNALIIRANPGIHEQVDNLLGLLRQKWGTLRTISVEGWWLWMTETEANRLLVGGRPKEGANANVFGAVSNLDFDGHLQALAEDKARRPGYRAKITCYNGQTVHTVSGGQQLYVTDVIPMVDGKSIAYRPVVALVQEGAALQVRPHSTRKGKYAAIDIHTRVNLLPEAANAPKELPADAADDAAAADEAPQADDDAVDDENANGGNVAKVTAQNAAAAIDRPRLQNARLSTSLRVPIDQVMLVGALSFDGQPAPGSENLYFFVKLSLQELRDDVEEEGAGEGIE